MDSSHMREALKVLVKGAVSQGTVKLSSGKLSDFYVDGRQVTLNPRGAFYIANIMADMLGDTDFDAFGGPTMGADPIIGALCYHFGRQEQAAPTGFIIRKEAKTHGLARRIEGPNVAPGARVVIVEDVVTSGSAVLQAIQAVEVAGARVVRALALVDREAGGREALRAQGYDLRAVFTRSELE